MNLGNHKGSMSRASSSGVVSDQFPAGLRVLVVDDDPTCLRILEKMLMTCFYEVTKCNRAEIALNMLRTNKNGYDIVISDVHMPDMDGFKLLEHVGLEMDLPVIMMSADDSRHVVMKGVTHGACDYLIKPVRIEALKTIWQHVVRKRKNEWKELEQSGSVEEVDRQPKPSEEVDYSSSANEGNWRNSKRRKDEEEEVKERDDTSTLKKQRVVWSVDLHQQFVSAVNQLGIDKAVPKKILEMMNVPGLTRENVASHLQKYRLYLRRLSGVSPHQGNPFISPHSQEPPYGLSLSGLDFQTLAATGQIPAQSLATLQAAGLARSNSNPGLPMPLVDQRNIVSFDNQKLRFGEGLPQHMSSCKQMNLLNGIPTTMDSKLLVNLHHSAQSLGSLNMQVNAHGGPSSQSSSLLMQMAQTQSRGQILNESTGGQGPRLPTSVGQPLLTNGAASGMLARNGSGENGRGTEYNSVSQASSMLNFPMNHSVELPGNSFPLGSTLGIASGMPTLTTKGAFQQDANSDIKGSGAFMSSYDIFNDLQQHNPHNWEQKNVGLTFDATQHSNSLQASVDITPSVFVNEGHSSSQRSGQNNSASPMGKPMFSVGEGSGHGNAQNICQRHLSHFHVDNSMRVKTERVADTICQPSFFHQQLGQEDLMSAILKQQQGGIGPAENDFEFDGCTLDNIPV